MKKIISYLAGLGLGLIAIKRYQNQKVKPVSTPLQTVQPTEQPTDKNGFTQAQPNTPIFLSDNRGLISNDIPYLMPMISRQDGGLIGSIYGDEIFSPVNVKSGDVVLDTSNHSITQSGFPDFEIVYDENISQGGLPVSYTRAISKKPVVVAPPAVQVKPITETHPPAMQGGAGTYNIDSFSNVNTVNPFTYH